MFSRFDELCPFQEPDRTDFDSSFESTQLFDRAGMKQHSQTLNTLLHSPVGHMMTTMNHETNQQSDLMMILSRKDFVLEKIKSAQKSR
jgi:hypothetical protein